MTLTSRARADMSNNAPAPQCQPKADPVRRFNIHWGYGRYTVDIPEYGGGEVVDAASYDALKARVEELEAALRTARARIDYLGAACINPKHSDANANVFLPAIDAALAQGMHGNGYAPKMPSREKIAALLKRDGFTSRGGTFLSAGTFGVIDAILALALPSTDDGSAA